MRDDAKYMQIHRCIRDREGRICAWLAGMSDADVRKYLAKHKGTYLSCERRDKNGYTFEDRF